MLDATRAKLMRKRPVAASTPKEQLTELEKWVPTYFDFITIITLRVFQACPRFINSHYAELEWYWRLSTKLAKFKLQSLDNR